MTADATPVPAWVERSRARSRRKHPVRSRTINVRQIKRAELELGRRLYPETDHQRPQTRGECGGVERPCPFVSCKHHLYLDTFDNGSIKLNFPDLEPWELKDSCALDVADRGGARLEDVGEVMNLTRERVRQLEVRALAKAERRPAMREYAHHENDDGHVHLHVLEAV